MLTSISIMKTRFEMVYYLTQNNEVIIYNNTVPTPGFSLTQRLNKFKFGKEIIVIVINLNLEKVIKFNMCKCVKIRIVFTLQIFDNNITINIYRNFEKNTYGEKAINYVNVLVDQIIGKSNFHNSKDKSNPKWIKAFYSLIYENFKEIRISKISKIREEFLWQDKFIENFNQKRSLDSSLMEIVSKNFYTLEDGSFLILIK